MLIITRENIVMFFGQERSSKHKSSGSFEVFHVLSLPFLAIVIMFFIITFW